MKKKDQILLENAYEQVASGSQYYAYEVLVSGMHSEQTVIEKQYTIAAKSIKDAQAKALGNYAKAIGDLDEFAEIVPARSEDLGIVNTGEESLTIVSKNKLSQEQIDDIVYSDDSFGHEAE